MTARTPATKRVDLGDLELASFKIEGLLEILYALSVSEECREMSNGFSVLVTSGQAALKTITTFVEQGGAVR